MNLGLYIPKFRIMPWIFNYLFCILPLCMGGMISIVETDERMEISFDWNSKNPKFKPNGAKISIPVLSNLVVTCPHMVDEYYKIYWVPKDAYENCFIPANVSLEKFLVCDKPWGPEAVYFELNIQTFTGVWGTKDFEIGKSYYLATMSSGTKEGLGNEFEGACLTDKMKLNITVIEKPLPTTKAPTDGNTRTTNKPPDRTTQRPKPTTTTPRPTTPSSTTTKKATTKLKTTSKPPSTDIPDINTGDIVIDGPNSGIIDASSGQSLTFPWLLVLSICLSVFHLVKLVR